MSYFDSQIMKFSNQTNKESEENKTIEEKKEVWLNSIKADGGAYKGCPKNDYCQNFVDTRERPQNFIRDYEEEKRFLGKYLFYLIIADAYIFCFNRSIYIFKILIKIFLTEKYIKSSIHH